MANNFGLYIVDATKHLAKEGYPEPSPIPINNTWVRTKLVNNGKPVNTTAIESNNLGAYKKDDKLYLNGSIVAQANSDTKAQVLANESGVSFGDAVLSRPTGVINITLDDYNSLRKGNIVEGYSKYNDKAVYNIVNDISVADDNIVIDLPDNIYDYVYNDKLKENPLSIDTMLDVNTPHLSFRHIDQYGEEGKGINVEYFVDTRLLDSVNKGEIGETFTVIVKDSYGNDLYYYEDEEGNIKHYTTYAGHRRITLRPFKDSNGNNIVGETWFSLQCIDSEGRGTCEHFFSVYIRETNYEETIEDYIYNVTLEDLSLYGITPDSNNAINAYKNRCGFARLIRDVKNKRNGLKDWTNTNYKGIRLYNANPDPANIRSSSNNSNTAYYINIYPDVNNHSIDKDLDDSSYKTRAAANFKFPTQDYYIFKYDAGSETVQPTLDTIRVKEAGNNDWATARFAEVDGVDSAVDWTKIRHADIEAFKIESGKTFEINGQPVTVTLNDGEDIVDWIWRDGAGICREGNKIIRHKNGLDDNDTNNEVYVSDWRNTHCLRVISINDNGWKTTLYKHKASYSDQITPGDPHAESPKDPAFYPFKPGSGYYYVSFYNGTKGDGATDDRFGISDIPMLDDFIIDFNYCSWRLQDALILRKRLNLLELGLSRNIEVRNGWIKGLYDGRDTGNEKAYMLKLLRRGYVAQNIITMIPWEAGGLVNFVASRFVTFKNMSVTGSLGYDIMAHGPSTHSYTESNFNIERKYVNTVGYTNVISGSFIKDKTCIIKDSDNTSLLPTSSFDYESGQSTDICLGTTSEYIDLSKVSSRGYKIYRNDEFNSRMCEDEFVIGSWQNRWCVKYPEFFVHFFDANNKYIRSVKTQINRRIKKLRGAAKAKVTMYLTGTLKNNVPYLYLPQKIIDRLERYKAMSCGIAENITYDSCWLGISKSSMIEPTVINMIVKDCTLNNVNRTPKGVATEHPYPISSEEHGPTQILFNLINSNIYNAVFTGEDVEDDVDLKLNKFQIRFAKGGSSVNIINSNGFTLYGAVDSGYIVNSHISTLNTSYYPNYIPVKHLIARDSIIRNGNVPGGHTRWQVKPTFDADQLNYLKYGKPYGACSASEERVNDLLSVEGCFFNTPYELRRGVVVTGRCYNTGYNVHDGKIDVSELEEAYTIFHNLLDQYIPSYLDTYGPYDEAWVHMLIKTTVAGETIKMTNWPKSMFGLPYTSTGGNQNKVPRYIDGVYYDSNLTNEATFKIPLDDSIEPGYHLLSLRFNRRAFSTNLYSVHIPTQCEAIRFPKWAGQRKDGEAILTLKDKFNASPLQFDKPCLVECLCEPFNFTFNAPNKPISIIIPEEQLINYQQHFAGTSYLQHINTNIFMEDFLINQENQD